MTTTRDPTLATPGRSALGRRSVWSWIAFDFAAQPFFTVVITFIFGPYFVSNLASDPAAGQTAWAMAAAATGILVAVLAPVLGAIADSAGPRKPWLAVLVLVQVAAMAALWFAAPGSSLVAVAALIVMAGVAAEFSVVFNDALLPGLVPRSSLGLVSNIAWGVGYVGGLLALILVIGAMAAEPTTGLTLFGLAPILGLDPDSFEAARATGPLAAVWYLAFVWPMFLFVPDRPRAPLAGDGAVRAGLSDLRRTVGELRARPALARFILARMLYQDGINGTLVLGGAFAAALFGWSVTESGVFGILLAFAATLGCIAAGFADRRFGARPVILAGLVLLILAIAGIVSTEPGSTLFGWLRFDAPTTPPPGLFATPAEKAYLVFGMLIGLAFGPVQASSRSLLAQSVEPGEAGCWFGIYALSGRASAFLAPLTVAGTTALAATLTDPQTAARIGMGALGLFFAAGFWILVMTLDTRAAFDVKPKAVRGERELP